MTNFETIQIVLLLISVLLSVIGLVVSNKYSKISRILSHNDNLIVKDSLELEQEKVRNEDIKNIAHLKIRVDDIKFDNGDIDDKGSIEDSIEDALIYGYAKCKFTVQNNSDSKITDVTFNYLDNNAIDIEKMKVNN